jgi:hypothetical protein
MNTTEINKPKPTLTDYEKLREYEESDDLFNNDTYLDFVNSINWDCETFEEGDFVGLKNALGEVILKPKYEDINVFLGFETNRDDHVAVKHNGKWGVAIADGIGTWLIEPEFDHIGYPNQLIPVYKNGKLGVLDIKLKEYLIPIECDSISYDYGFMFINGLAVYRKNDKQGVINDRGEFTDAIFDEVDWAEGSVKVLFNGEWGFIDEKNQFTLDEDEAYYSADDGF